MGSFGGVGSALGGLRKLYQTVAAVLLLAFLV